MTKPCKKKSFLKKLNAILNKKQYEKYIKWNRKNKTLIIENIKQFSENVLKKWFNHKDFSSFVRQLNSYNFKKIKDSSKNCIIYESNLFYKNMPEKDLVNIEAKHNSNKKNKLNIDILPNNDLVNNNELEEGKINNKEIKDKLNECLNDLKKMIEKQESLSKDFEKLKKINIQQKMEKKFMIEDIKTTSKQDDDINNYKLNLMQNESTISNNEIHFDNDNINNVHNSFICINGQYYSNNNLKETNNQLTTSRRIEEKIK